MIDHHVAGGIKDSLFVGTFLEEGFYDEFHECGLSDLAGTPYREDVSGGESYLVQYRGSPAVSLLEITADLPVLVDLRLPLPPYVLIGIVRDIHYLVLWFLSTYNYPGIAIPEFGRVWRLDNFRT